MRLLRVGARGRRGASRARPAILALLVFALLAVPASASAAPLSIRIDGNHFVNGDGQTIRLLGVDVTSSEYACADNYGFDDGHFDDEDAAQIASWKANAVRVPLNEDCWLNINLPAGDPYGGAGYRAEIEQYVADLNAHGIYAILDLHWTAPGAQTALEQQPMPDFDHSPAFWTSVAGAFKDNPAVVFDLFNEPFDPTDPRSGDDPLAQDAVTWGCWATGTKPDLVGGGAPDEPCVTQAYDENGTPTTRYRIAGMQTLVDAIRATGATQPVMTGGLDYADDLSQWAEHAPDDPLNQEAASFHNYMGKECDNVGCWNSEVAPVAANVPVVTGEFAEDNYEEPGCNASPNNFDEEYMDWADAHAVSYLAWAWFVPDPPTVGEDTCERYYMIGDYSGTPASVNGIAVHDHLLSLATGGGGAGGGGGGSTDTGGGGAPGGNSTSSGGGSKSTPGHAPIKLTRFSSSVQAGGAAVALHLKVATSCKVTIVGQTVKRFALGGKMKRKVTLGKASASLTAGKSKTVVLRLSAKAQALLRSQGSLPSRFTLTLTGGGTTSTASRTATLKQPHAS